MLLCYIMAYMAIEFFTVTTTKPVVAHLVTTISHHLAAKHKISWLISGGSSAKIAMETAKRIENGSLENIHNLTVSLMDERYGPVGHSDSNWQLLNDVGFKINGANMLPVLMGKSLNQTAKNYGQFIEKVLKENDYILGLVGIGADGHTLGIEPDSPATQSRSLICAYNGDGYVRLTLTPQTIKKFDEIVAYAVGDEKRRVLDDLDKPIPPKKQPAQFLKTARKLTVYNDYKGTPL